MGHDVGARRIEALIEEIYGAAVAPETWPAVLAGMADVFSAGFCDVFSRSHDRLHFGGLAHGLDRSDYEDQFLGVWFKRNVWGLTRPVEVAGEVLSTRQMVDVEALRRSEIFGEYLDPRGLHEGLRLSLWAGAESIQDVSILRPWSAGAFGPAEVALGEALLPHLQRAAAVTRRMRHLSLEDELGEGPTSCGHVVMGFDRAGRVSHRNAAAQDVLASGRVLRLEGGTLHAVTSAATRDLRRALATALGWSTSLPAGSVVALPRPDRPSTLQVAILPVSSSIDWAMPRPPAALAILRDPASLTVPGDVLQKTGTRRQVDLVRLLADLATIAPRDWR